MWVSAMDGGPRIDVEMCTKIKYVYQLNCTEIVNKKLNLNL